MSDAWEEIQAIKSKRNSLREKLEKRKKERQDILGSSLNPSDSPGSVASLSKPTHDVSSPNVSSPSVTIESELSDATEPGADTVKSDPELEKELLKALCEVSLTIPVNSSELTSSLKTSLNRHVSHSAVCNLLQKFATQRLIKYTHSFRLVALCNYVFLQY